MNAEQVASALVQCIACGGEGSDDSDECGIIRCPACNGTGVLSWPRVCWLGLADRYDAKTQLERGTLVVREAIVAIGGPL